MSSAGRANEPHKWTDHEALGMFVLQQFGPILNVVDDPISILLVLVGAVLIGASSGLVGYLAAGAALDLVTTD